MASLAASVLEPLDPSTKISIIEALWGPIPRRLVRNTDDASFEAFWAFYRKECEVALHDEGKHCLVRHHQDIVDIVSLLKEQQSRDEIRAFLRWKLTKEHANEDELLDTAIDLSARLLYLVDFGHLHYGFCGRRQLAWTKTKGSVQDCLDGHFGNPSVLGHQGVKLQRVFNAVHLEKIAGVHVMPTDNLADHLRLIDDDTQLYVFHHASVLRCQSSSSILPVDLAEETLRTLALLFPETDAPTKKWLRRTVPTLSFDPQLARCGNLKTDDRQIESFTYWHDRLVVLKQVFDEATPSTMSQWWHDRRNGVQWYTFWVAITVLALTLLFGLVQSVEGAMQVYGTFHGNNNH